MRLFDSVYCQFRRPFATVRRLRRCSKRRQETAREMCVVELTRCFVETAARLYATKTANARLRLGCYCPQPVVNKQAPLLYVILNVYIQKTELFGGIREKLQKWPTFNSHDGSTNRR